MPCSKSARGAAGRGRSALLLGIVLASDACARDTLAQLDRRLADGDDLALVSTEVVAGAHRVDVPVGAAHGATALESYEERASPYLNLERPDDDARAVLESASVRCRIAVGPIAERKTPRLQGAGAVDAGAESAKELTATRDGF